MAPTPRPTPKPEDRLASGHRLSHPDPGDEVLITGISGYFPDSLSVDELKHNLFNKVDLITNDGRRWKLAHPEIPQRTGKINNVNKFDASFFGVHYKQAHTMDPMCRLLLEKAYEAIIDAGMNPKQFRNTKTGVFIGACFSESEKTWFYEKMQVNGFGITGCSRAMLANRISYWLGCTGPSYTVDSACSSSLYALEHAFRAIRDGHCDAAIVGGSNLCLHPYVSLQFSRLGVLSPEGKCRSFDKDANGYVRSEAVSVCLLQKAKDSRRVYAQVLHAKTNCDGYKEQGITYPAGHIQKMLLKEFYEECLVPPQDLEFIEAHGTGTRVGDPEELKALDEIFCTKRTEPLLIGSIKSNLGHSEPASGLCSIAKMCIAYSIGLIPPNLHYKEPREGVKALYDGRLKVVTEGTPWNLGMSGVNSFGFGGANAHVLLKNYSKNKINKGRSRDDLPRLVGVSGRSEAAVARILNDLESRLVDVEQIRLWHGVHEYDIQGHVYRGYVLLDTKTDVLERLTISRDCQYFPGVRRPIWFVFSGMGSQWCGMGTQLMRIPVFAAAIERCHKVLKPKGLDIAHIITSPDRKIFDNILHSFVGIAAVQIGLCDILTTMGIEPDYLIGHSVGELGCAYADGCFTAEQMILAAYSRGLASIETLFIRGSMAAVGLGYQQVKNLCPSDIEVACHNGPNSSTISGPADNMKKFVATLQSQGIFAKEVNCSNIAYHSKYISEAGPTLLKYLREVIPNPKPRSSRWVSTSVPQAQWRDEKALLSSAEYHTNNLLNAVLFDETSRLIPGNAITIEIAPHGLLQAILRRSLKPECTNIPLTKNGHPDNVTFLLNAIGKLYEVGLNPKIDEIYPTVEFPVARGTPMLSHLVEWEHSEDWYVTSYQAQEKMKSGERTVRMSIADEDSEYMIGHVVDGRNLYPATGYLVLVWETVGMMMGKLFTEVSVVFENVRFQRATNIPTEGNLEFVIMVQKGSGNFEIVEGGAAIVTGNITAKKDVSKEYRSFPEPIQESGQYVRNLNTRDVYKELRLRGYNYSGLFRGILSSNIEGNRGQLSWINNWVTFLDTMLQMKILAHDTRNMHVPTRIEKLSIDTKKHYSMITGDVSQQTFEVSLYKSEDVIRCGGVEFRGVHATPITKKQPRGVPVLERYEFVPHFARNIMPMNDVLRFNLQLALENVQAIKVKVIELIDCEAFDHDKKPLAIMIRDILGDIPLIQSDILVVAEDPLELGPNITVENKKLSGETNTLFFVGTNLLQRDAVCTQGVATLKEKGFVISRETRTNLDADEYSYMYDILAATHVENELLVLFRKRIGSKPAKFITISIEDKAFSWIDKVKTEMKDCDKLVLVSQNEPLSGLLGLVNCLRREPGGDIIKCIIILDPTAPEFNPDLAFYEEQLDKDLAFNVYSNGEWGTYRHLEIGDMSHVKTEHAYVNVQLRGDLSSLDWIEGQLKANVPIKQPDRQLVQVYYSSINFRDIMTATGRISVEAVARGRLNQECVQGLEFCGRTAQGERVMGMASHGALANMVAADNCLLWRIPDNWTFEEAATIPTAYGTVYYALFMVVKLRPGERVLIHAGSGGVGQAAIRVCLFYGCTVFTTVGTPEKRAFIKKLFPQIKDSHIGNSRDTSFEDMIRRETNGEGVGLVINSLAEDKLQATLRCLGYGSRFVEIGKFDTVNNTNIGMGFFIKEVTIAGIMMDFIFEQDSEFRTQIQNLLYDGIKSGAVVPLVRTVFNKDEVEKAFRYMANGKHIGKVIIKLREEEPIKIMKPEFMPIQAIPRYTCIEDQTYVIVGGLGGFGLELTDWLIMRGARKILLNSRSGVKNGYQASRLRTWKTYGAQIEIATDDVITYDGCVSLLKKANDLGPVIAIFNLAVVLKDALFDNQTPETFKQSMAPKSIATSHLDKASREMCPLLKEFVIFSSVACGRGNAGQTNYGTSNSIMERICEARKSEGLPALAVQWGVVGEVGLVADMHEMQFEMEICGTLQQSISSCLASLDKFLKLPHPVVSSMVVAVKKVGGTGCGSIVDTVAAIMGLKDIKMVSQQVSLAELGMDSMMAVEIKQALEREFEIFLTAQDIRILTFSRLLELTAEREAQASTSASNKGSVGEIQIGLKVLLRNIGDELTASEPIINMATMISDGIEGEHDICDSDPILFMIPGIEGMATALEPISKRLKTKVSTLQLGFDHYNETIKDTANRLLNTLRSRLAPNAPYTILSYSFGTLVALEMASTLEAEGHNGTLFILDGSPDFLYALVKMTMNTTDENEFQDLLLCHTMDVLVPNKSKELREALKSSTNWDSKVEMLLMRVPDSIKHSKQYQQALCNISYERINMIKNYDSANIKKLKSPIILMRPKDNPPGVVIEDNYGLDKYSEQPVTVHFLEGNHATIVENKDCANIINRLLMSNQRAIAEKTGRKLISGVLHNPELKV